MKARLEVARFQNKTVLKILPDVQELVGSEQGEHVLACSDGPACAIPLTAMVRKRRAFV